MKRFSVDSQVQRPLWQTLLAPMLLASLGLHGLFLLLPAGSSNEAIIPPPDPEQDSVAITRVPPAETGPAGQPAGPTPTTAVPIPAEQAQRLAAPPPSGRSAAPTRPGVARTLQQGARSAPVARATPQPSPAPASSTAEPASPSSSAASGPAAGTTPVASSQPLFDPDLRERLLAYAATLSLPQAQIDRLSTSIQNRYRYAAATTTREAYSENLSRWETTMRQETGVADLANEIDRSPFSVAYSQRVCLTHPPGEVRIGAVANPDGSRRGDPVVLRSSGYGAVDAKALGAVQTHRFPAAEGIKAYVLTVNIEVDHGRRPCLETSPDA